MSDLEQYRKLAQPPSWALKTIGGGRLKGMTDIKPAWRIQAMTEVYGLCGVGWKYAVTRSWTEPGSESQVFAFVDVLLFVKVDGEWSEGIPGNGGSKLVDKETRGLYSDDEAFKKATTDALGSAMKMIGMAADVYAGQWTGSKYLNEAEPPAEPTDQEKAYIRDCLADITKAQNKLQLDAIGHTLKNKSAAIRNGVEAAYRKKQAELKESANAPSST